MECWKEVLIKDMIQAIPSYVMSILSLPKTFASITAYVANFWWKSNGKYRGIHQKNIETLCSPKSLGVLGFRDFNKMNTTLLAKHGIYFESHLFSKF